MYGPNECWAGAFSRGRGQNGRLVTRMTFRNWRAYLMRLCMFDAVVIAAALYASGGASSRWSDRYRWGLSAWSIGDRVATSCAPRARRRTAHGSACALGRIYERVLGQRSGNVASRTVERICAVGVAGLVELGRRCRCWGACSTGEGAHVCAETSYCSRAWYNPMTVLRNRSVCCVLYRV